MPHTQKKLNPPRAAFDQVMFPFEFQALRVLRTAEFAPFVVFIAAPGMSALAELKKINNVSQRIIQRRRTFKFCFLSNSTRQFSVCTARATFCVYCVGYNRRARESISLSARWSPTVFIWHGRRGSK